MAHTTLDRQALETAVRGYFDACNNTDLEAFQRLFVADAVHYLPAGMFGPIHGVLPLAARWEEDVVRNGASWAIDALLVDVDRRQAMAEWTAFKPAQHKLFRGVDCFVFTAEGLISEVRVYYASARDERRGANELGGFPYAERGWSMPDYPLRDATAAAPSQ